MADLLPFFCWIWLGAEARLGLDAGYVLGGFSLDFGWMLLGAEARLRLDVG